MKCKYCQDEGKLYMPGKFIKCPDCQQLTNEEYIRNCSTGDLAALIYQDRWTQSDGWYEQTGHTVEDVKKWLKEIRK